MDAGPEPATRDELDQLARRMEALERLVAAQGASARVTRCGACDATVPAGRYCARCGERLERAPPREPVVPAVQYHPVETPAPPKVIAPPPAPAEPIAAPPAPQAVVWERRALPPPASVQAAPVAKASKPTVEAMLGQRWAPRLGAILVFLGVVFFLGVAVQRGWIGPVAQLMLAALLGAGFVAAGGVLTHRRGHGTYPQILEGTGACVLYVTAFVSHALPYYQEATHFSTAVGGVAMALVALGTVGLALVRDARVIAGLGYTLAFATASLGREALPSFTLPYAALLGTSLAVVIARKRWNFEAAAGTVATGAFFLSLFARSRATGDPSPILLAACALLPAAAFLWFAARPSFAPASQPAKGLDEAIAPFVALATLAWACVTTLAPASSWNTQGVVILAWAIAAAAHAAWAARAGARTSAAASSFAALAFWIIGAPLAWSGVRESALLVTATYALGAVAIAMLRARGAPYGSLVLMVTAGFQAVVGSAVLAAPRGDGLSFGDARAWIAFALVAGAFAALLAARAQNGATARRAGLILFSAFAALMTFAQGATPVGVTLALGLVAGALYAMGLLRSPRAADLAPDLALAAAALLAVNAVQSVLASDVGSGWRIAQGAMVLSFLLGAFLLGGTSRYERPGRPFGPVLLVGALILWPFTFWDGPQGPLLATTSYAVAALTLGAIAARASGHRHVDPWAASFALAAAAALHAVFGQGLLHAPWASSPRAFGPWDAWVTLALVAAPLALALSRLNYIGRPEIRAAILVAVASFASLWGFALFHAPVGVTVWLLVVAGGLVGLAARGGAQSAMSAALAILAVAAAKVATLDMHASTVKLSLPWAAAQAALVAGALVAVFHLARARGLLSAGASAPAAIGLVGGSALVLVDLTLAYGEGAWTSLVLGALGVAYLAAGFALRAVALYRYTGFAVLGVVVLRVLAVDLKELDLALRALVFAALGATLLGIGYVYARVSRKEEPPPEETAVDQQT